MPVPPPASGARRSDADADDPVRSLWRALVIYRTLAYGFAVLATTLRWEHFRNHGWTIAVLAAMAVWTLFITIAYSRERGRNQRTAMYDLIVTVACMASTTLAVGAPRVGRDVVIITSVWAGGPALALAIASGMAAGLFGAIVINTAVVVLRRETTLQELNNLQLLVLGGLVVGYASGTMRRHHERLRTAIAAESAAAERERFARNIHDGVLQVLAQVHRRAPALGPDGAVLAAEAGEQEIALRRLITTGRLHEQTRHDARLDLNLALQELVAARVEVVGPATPVMLPEATVEELVAAVREALANVDKHAGDEARAWVVLEDLGDEVSVLVRDDGVGTTPEHVAAAADDGHMG